jgi:hypothetical protein
VEQIPIDISPTTIISVVALLVAFLALVLRKRSKRKMTRKKRQAKEVTVKA